MSSQGRLFVIAAPSGAGKTSLVKALVAADDSIVISVSHTTRAPRPGDEDGVHYHFVNQSAFQLMVEQQDFLEHADVFGHQYGTSRSWVEQQLAAGKDVVLEIDWQGARQVCGQFPSAISVFILPPSEQALLERLHQRGQDNTTVITQRMAGAMEEIVHYQEFEYIIVNDDFATALLDFQAIVRVAQLSCETQEQRHAPLLAELLKKR